MTKASDFPSSPFIRSLNNRLSNILSSESTFFRPEHALKKILQNKNIFYICRNKSIIVEWLNYQNPKSN